MLSKYRKLLAARKPIYNLTLKTNVHLAVQLLRLKIFKGPIAHLMY